MLLADKSKWKDIGIVNREKDVISKEILEVESELLTLYHEYKEVAHTGNPEAFLRDTFKKINYDTYVLNNDFFINSNSGGYIIRSRKYDELCYAVSFK